ncbi:hypothetical protein [Nitratireductor sp. CH_MIT9313-5]|uniref:hypothetical protein n=1 Tax=Nitratireductor sp. CH_MIT9313-5 TaxID=3107764 RepID=UPI0030085EF1
MQIRARCLMPQCGYDYELDAGVLEHRLGHDFSLSGENLPLGSLRCSKCGSANFDVVVAEHRFT